MAPTGSRLAGAARPDEEQMQRFILCEGVKGSLVAHPSSIIGSRRHPGMSRRMLAEGEKLESLADLYEPVREVFPVHKCLMRAIGNGELRLLAGPVVAKDMAEATALLAAAAKPKLAKKGDS